MRVPISPHLTGSDAWVQRSSPTSRFSVVDTDSHRTASNFISSGLPVHGAVLRRYINRGTVRAFRSKYKLLCDGMSSNRLGNRCSSRCLLSCTASRSLPRSDQLTAVRPVKNICRAGLRQVDAL